MIDQEPITKGRMSPRPPQEMYWPEFLQTWPDRQITVCWPADAPDITTITRGLVLSLVEEINLHRRMTNVAKANALDGESVATYATGTGADGDVRMMARELLACRHAIGGHDDRDTLHDLLTTVRALVNDSTGSTFDDARRHSDAYAILGEVLDRLSTVTP